MGIKQTVVALATALAVPSLAMADTLDQVRESGTFTIGYRNDAAPFSLQREDGQAAGYSVDLCIDIAKAVGDHLGRADLEVVYRPVTAETRFAALAEAEIDILCGATTVTLSRRDTMDFTLLTFVTGAAVLVRRDSPIDSLVDTAGGRVGVLGDTTTEQALRNSLEAERIAAEVVTFEERPQGLEALLTGEIDAFFGDRELLFGLAMTLAEPEAVRLTSRYLTMEPYALAIRRGDDELRLVADRTLARLYQGGGITPIFERWFVGMRPGDLLRAVFVLQSFPE